MYGKMWRKNYLSLRLGAQGRTAHCVRAIVDTAARRCIISKALADRLNLEGTAGHPVVTMLTNGGVLSVGSYKHAVIENVYWCPREINWVNVTIMSDLSVDMIITGETYNRLKMRGE